jgi:hypothetical protein
MWGCAVAAIAAIAAGARGRVGVLAGHIDRGLRQVDI